MARYSYDVGEYVECDMCATVLTDDPRSGGFLFGSKGVGPCCAERMERSAQEYGELEYIRQRCPAGVSFADWIRTMRAGTPDGNTVTILSGDDAWDFLGGAEDDDGLDDEEPF